MNLDHLLESLTNKECKTIQQTFEEINKIISIKDIEEFSLESKDNEIIKLNVTIIDINDEFMNVIRLNNGNYTGFLYENLNENDIDINNLNNFTYLVGIINNIDGKEIWKNLFKNQNSEFKDLNLEYPVILKVYNKKEDFRIGKKYSFTGILNKKEQLDSEDKEFKNFIDFYDKSIIREITVLKYEEYTFIPNNENKHIFNNFFINILNIFNNDKIAATLFLMNILNIENKYINYILKDYLSINFYYEDIDFSLIDNLIRILLLVKSNINQYILDNEFIKNNNLFPKKCYDYNIIRPGVFSQSRYSLNIFIEKGFKEEKFGQIGALNINFLNEMIENNKILINFSNSYNFEFLSNIKFISFSEQKSLFKFKLNHKLKNNLNSDSIKELKAFLLEKNNIEIIKDFLNHKINDYSSELIEKITEDYSLSRQNRKDYTPEILEKLIIITKYYSFFTSKENEISFEDFKKIKNSFFSE